MLLMNKALVITPTTGRQTLVDAIKSVQNQTVPTDHLIVIDGPEHVWSANKQLSTVDGSNINVLSLPFNTGKNNFWGHRIIAAMSQIVDHDYIFLLDDDDWYDSNHVESMIDVMKSGDLDWSFGLRKIWTFDKSKFLHDYCVSIGSLCHNTNPDKYIVATSSYGFTNKFIKENGHHWFDGYGADQNFYRKIGIRNKHQSNNEYTVNYRLDWSNGEEDMELIRIASGAHESCDHSLIGSGMAMDGAYARIVYN